MRGFTVLIDVQIAHGIKGSLQSRTVSLDHLAGRHDCGWRSEEVWRSKQSFKQTCKTPGSMSGKEEEEEEDRGEVQRKAVSEGLIGEGRKQARRKPMTAERKGREEGGSVPPTMVTESR